VIAWPDAGVGSGRHRGETRHRGRSLAGCPSQFANAERQEFQFPVNQHSLTLAFALQDETSTPAARKAAKIAILLRATWR